MQQDQLVGGEDVCEEEKSNYFSNSKKFFF